MPDDYLRTQEPFPRGTSSDRLDREVELRLRAGAVQSRFEQTVDGYVLYTEWLLRPVAEPTIALPSLHISEPKEASVEGLLVGLIPDLDPAVAENVDALLGPDLPVDINQLDNTPASKYLRSNEVAYIVIGKWPPRGRSTPLRSRSDLSLPGRKLFDVVDSGQVLSIVEGRWPIIRPRKR